VLEVYAVKLQNNGKEAMKIEILWESSIRNWGSEAVCGMRRDRAEVLGQS